MPGGSSREILRFGDFELDVAAYELRRQGVAVRLERQPMDMLLLLVQRRGELVSRADIIDRLWGKDVFVDVDTGVHTAARKIRQALGDSVGAPTYVETVPGRGYRFIAPIHVVPAVDLEAPTAVPHEPGLSPAGGTEPVRSMPPKRFEIRRGGAFALLAFQARNPALGIA